MLQQVNDFIPKDLPINLYQNSLPRKKRHPAFDSLITSDPQMEKIFSLLERVAETNSTVLILGESGTGKELIARAIHEISGCSGHFVPVNCGAIPDNLLESELFGYEKGAFTGALNSKPGRFVLADGGTIFLDEIGEMKPHLQVKILRVLQERIVEAVGATRSRPVQLRVVAATNVDLRELVKQGKFREDLFYRLQVVPVELPPLRNRKSDIEVLAKYFSQKYCRNKLQKPLEFSSEVIEKFKQYHWAGNIRELENLIERLSILVENDCVNIDHLPSHVLESSWSNPAYPIPTSLPEEGVDFNIVVEQLENSLIMQALERTGGNKKAAARLLKLNRTTLVEKIKKKGLEVKDPEENEGNLAMY